MVYKFSLTVGFGQKTRFWFGFSCFDECVI